jgi:hypothetical protein
MQILPIDFPIPDEPPVIKTTLPSIAICARRVQKKKNPEGRPNIVLNFEKNLKIS